MAELNYTQMVQAHEYAVQLFKTVAPQCVPLEESPTGVISQLDNFISGTMTERDSLRDEVRRLRDLLEDVENELDLSESMIERHGPLGTPPAELVREVLAQKDQIILMLKQGFVDAALSPAPPAEPQEQGLIGGAAPGLQEPPPSYRSRLLEEDKQPAEPTVPVKFQNIGPILSDEVCHPIEPPKVRRNVVFAEPVGGTGGYLVTLDCGHKLATRKQQISYDCRECEKETTNG